MNKTLSLLHSTLDTMMAYPVEQSLSPQEHKLLASLLRRLVKEKGTNTGLPIYTGWEARTHFIYTCVRNWQWFGVTKNQEEESGGNGCCAGSSGRKDARGPCSRPIWPKFFDKIQKMIATPCCSQKPSQPIKCPQMTHSPSRWTSACQMPRPESYAIGQNNMASAPCVRREVQKQGQ